MLSLPPALLKSLEGVPGFSRSSFEAVHAAEKQVTSIRTNPFKIPLAGLPSGLPIPWCAHGLYLSERPFFTFDPLLHAGAYYVQEPSSMFLWHALQHTVGIGTECKVLDLCAAPGGKTTLLASYFTNGLLVANEVIKNRAAVLVENTTKWGIENLVVTNNDAAHFKSLPAFFDVLVVDAPCSGSGLFRKDPDAINEWSEDAVTLCSQRQQRILADALVTLKEEGILIYATCSYSPEEDEGIADWLTTEMDMETIRIPINPKWGILESPSPQTQAFGYRFFPDQVPGEGFFLAAFQKKKKEIQNRVGRNSLLQPSKIEINQLSAFLPFPDGRKLFKPAGAIRAISEIWWNDLGILANHLYIKKAGIELGSIKGKDVIPSHELAMCIWPLHNMTSVDVDKHTALQYLRRKEMELTALKGWNLIRYEGLPLGWMKSLGNRINNYYPVEWRILKD